MKDRAAANPVDRDAVNQIGVTVRLSGAHRPSEKAQGIGLDAGISEPPDINSDPAGLAHWQECYGDLWELKLAFEKEHNR